MNSERKCFSCGETGHISRYCPKKNGGGGRSVSSRGVGHVQQILCYKCGNYGHFECSGRGGGIVKCYNCGGYGHYARNCDGGMGGSGGCNVRGGRDKLDEIPHEHVGDVKCGNCDNSGHLSAECPFGASGGSGRYSVESRGSGSSDFNDRTIEPVVLNKNLKKLSGKKIKSSPQSLLDAAVFRYGRREGLLSSENAWLSSSMQLKFFMLHHNLDPKTHSAKNRVVSYLRHFCLCKSKSKKMNIAWMALQASHSNGFEDSFGLDDVYQFLISSRNFSNFVHQIYVEGSFNAKHFIEWFPKELDHEILLFRNNEAKTLGTWRMIDKKERELEDKENLKT